MAFFGGPSDHVLITTARGIAGEYASLAFLEKTFGTSDNLPDYLKKERAEQGLPTTRDDLVRMAADVIHQYELGWFKRNRFLGIIEGSLRAVGLDAHEPRFLKGLIEIHWHKSNCTKRDAHH